MKVLAVRAELCVACRVCEDVCATTFFQVSERDRSAIRVSVPDVSDADCQVIFCDQCGECIAICPTNALFRTKSGIVRLRKKDCVGCMSCVAFCPTLAMYVYPGDVLPFKCVACGKCAEQCPTDALYMAEEDVPPDTNEMTRLIRSKTGEVPHGH